MPIDLRHLVKIGVVAFSLGLHVLSGPASAETRLLNASYDVSRELYKDINKAFRAAWKKRTGHDVIVNQSHGGSSRQALSVIGGLEADVVTMNQAPDIDILVKRGGLVSEHWRTEFPHDASPYFTTSVFLVRKGNPKGIRDWNDLVKSGISVIVPNPKTSGNGRYTYLAAWGYALQREKSAEGASAFVAALFKNVPVLDGGGRGASTTFTQRDVGDVLVTFENEAVQLERELGSGRFEIVYPSISINASAPVAIVSKVVDKHGTREVSKGYLEFLFSPEGQEIIARHHFRPRDPAILAAHARNFPAIATFTVEERFGGWEAVQGDHFSDGGIFDRIVTRR